MEFQNKAGISENVEHANFTTEPDFHIFPDSFFSNVKFCKKNKQLFIQIAVNENDLKDIKLTATIKSLILRVRCEKNNYIRIVSLPQQVNVEQGKAEFLNNILTIWFPILVTNSEIKVNEK